MKSPLAAATHYCTLLCLSHGDLSLYLSVCLSVSLPGWLLTTAVCVTVAHILSTLIVCLYGLLLVCFVLAWQCLFVLSAVLNCFMILLFEFECLSFFAIRLSARLSP